jgi:hypothetical protein
MARGPESRERPGEALGGRVALGLGGGPGGGRYRFRRAVYRVRGGAHGLALHWFIFSRVLLGGGGREPICFKAYVCGLASSLCARQHASLSLWLAVLPHRETGQAPRAQSRPGSFAEK